MDAQSQRAESPADRGEKRARAVRAVVFLARLFEYECRDLGVSLAQYRLLLYLRHGPRRAGELAAQASMARPALSTLIAAMEKQGLIRRGSVSVDKRGVRLELARKGLSAIQRVEERFGRVFDDAADQSDREALVEALNGITRRLTRQIESRVRPDAFGAPDANGSAAVSD